MKSIFSQRCSKSKKNFEILLQFPIKKKVTNTLAKSWWIKMHLLPFPLHLNQINIKLKPVSFWNGLVSNQKKHNWFQSILFNILKFFEITKLYCNTTVFHLLFSRIILCNSKIMPVATLYMNLIFHQFCNKTYFKKGVINLHERLTIEWLFEKIIFKKYHTPLFVFGV